MSTGQPPKHFSQFWDRVTENIRPFAEAYDLVNGILPVESADGVRGRTVLDAGCGAGDYSAVMEKMGARRVAAFDVSLSNLRLARAKTPTTQFARANLSELPYASGAFDIIWVWGVLHFVADPHAALREIVRVLSPGGVAVIHTTRRGVWSSLEVNAARVLSRTPAWVEPLVLDIGDRAVPLVSRLITGKAPQEQTSKSVRHKLHERLFVPDVKAFSLEQLLSILGSSVQVQQIHPQVADLFQRNVNLTLLVRKPTINPSSSAGAHTSP